jgi:acyl CoA:acetate/3-ketoacid CoA transferase alpha subunit
MSRRYFDLKPNEGESKVTSLDKAVSQYIKSGMHIYSAYLPFATAHEIVRQFHGQGAAFTVSCLGAVENVNILIAAGLVKRLISSYAGIILPSPAVSGVVQRALQEGMEMENWSLLTMVQRLIGGALSLPFMPTSSLEGSTMAEENAKMGLYTKIPEPFGKGEIGLIKSLKPDIAIMHAYCADQAGNAIPVLSPAEEAYGAFASRGGVILSVEKIVSTEYLRKHSMCVRVPASTVRCVTEAPFGAHPYGCRGNDDEGYGEDAEFGKHLQEAIKEKDTADAWLKEWILDIESHEEYLRKVGHERLQRLRSRISYSSWRADALKITESVSNVPPNRAERAAIFASREIIDSVEKHGYDTILAGIGISHLAAWIATHRLRDRDVPIDLLVELGASGLVPPPGQPFLLPVRGMESCPMLTDVLGILGFIANNTRMLGSLSAGQIDKYGNINSTKVGDFFLFGSGGANDVSVKAREIVVTLVQDARRLVEKVPYVTCPGQNVKKLVTDRAVFEKVDEEFVLKRISVEEGESEEEVLEIIVQNMGWKPKRAEKLVWLDVPIQEEILMLRCFDPERYFLGKLKKN